MKKGIDLSQDAKLNIGEKLAYSFGGAFGNGVLNVFTTTFILIFYTEIMHVNVGLAAGVIGVSKVFDGVSDLIIGKIIDNTHHKMGKTRIWLLRIIPFSVLSLFAIILMPFNMPTAIQVIYMFITYNMASTVCYTFVYVAFMSLNGLITRHQGSRGSLGGLTMIGNVIISLISNATIITLLNLLSKNKDYSAYGDRQGWVILVGIYCVVYVISELILVFFTHERVEENVDTNESENHEKKKNVPALVTVKALVTNKYWIINIIVCISIFFLMGASGSTASYFMTYVLEDVNFYQVYSSINSLCMLAALLIGFPLFHKLGKRNAVIVGLMIRLIGSVIPLLGIAKPIILAGGVLNGLGYGIAGCAFASVIQDALTYGEWKNGFGMIGMGNAANSFSSKIGQSLGTIFLGWIMNFTGFVSGAAVQISSAVNGLFVMHVWVPAVFTLIGLVAICFYDLDKIYPSIVADLKEGKYAPGVKSYIEK